MFRRIDRHNILHPPPLDPSRSMMVENVPEINTEPWKIMMVITCMEVKSSGKSLVEVVRKISKIAIMLNP